MDVRDYAVVSSLVRRRMDERHQLDLTRRLVTMHDIRSAVWGDSDEFSRTTGRIMEELEQAHPDLLAVKRSRQRENWEALRGIGEG